MFLIGKLTKLMYLGYHEFGHSPETGQTWDNLLTIRGAAIFIVF